jgi:uncharacterized membrane protein (DUF485 family)
MSDGTAPDVARAATAGQDGHAAEVDWTRIEGSEAFRELTGRRHRFIALAATVTFGAFLVYLVLAVFAPGVMGTTIGGVPLAWPVAMTMVFLTWAVTWTYLRKADHEFEPLEERAIERGRARFARDDGAPDDRATAEHRPAVERSAR